MENLIKFYAEHIDESMKQFDICVKNYRRTQDTEWREMAVGWMVSAQEWLDTAREEGVYIV